MTWLSVREPYRELLRRSGLRQFSDFIEFSGGKVLKTLPSRTILKFDLSLDGEIKTFFMKRHRERASWREGLRAYFSGFSRSWGRKEWEAIHAFEKNGIPTLTPVASGERVSGRRQESFVMTEELMGFESLEAFLKKYGSLPLTAEKIYEKRSIIRELAGIAKRMHAAGFNHRDFYCCHLFLRALGPERREWRVLDLQRVDRRRLFRRRWIIKDLAALNYSAPWPLVTRMDRLRFLRDYLGNDDDRLKRSFIRQITRKTEQIREHDRKLQKRKAQAADARMRSLSA